MNTRNFKPEYLVEWKALRHGFYTNVLNVVYSVLCWKICETLLIIRLTVSCCYWILYLGILTLGYWQHSESVRNGLFILRRAHHSMKYSNDHERVTSTNYDFMRPSECWSVVCSEACLQGRVQHNSVIEDRTSSKSAYCIPLCLCLFTYTRWGNVTSLNSQFDDRLQHLMW